MAEKQAKEKTILGVFRGRRRPVTFSSGKTPKEECENLLKAVLTAFCDLVESKDDTFVTSHYYLQVESSEWKGSCIDA